MTGRNFSLHCSSVVVARNDGDNCSPHLESRIKKRKRGAEDYFNSEVLEDLGDKISNNSTLYPIDMDMTQEEKTCLFSLQLNFPDSTVRINLHFHICRPKIENIFEICKNYLLV